MAWWRRAATRGSRPPIAPCAEAGKPPKVAIVATGRHLVTIANALIREDITFAQSRFAS